ncbi:MAG: YfhO family protein [Candidatus Pacearchaeota archaeon]|nr:YfhO family protein [Candidatus Pacearchaeota archaeon]
MKNKIIISLIGCIMLFSLTSAFLISDQGTSVREKSTGNLLSNGKLTILIYDSAENGNLIFEQEIENAIINGSWNLVINPNLEYGKKYWKDYKINEEDVDFDGNERIEFQSSAGRINDISFINFSLIAKCEEGSSIRVIYENGSVLCEDDSIGESDIELTNYALKNQSERFNGNITAEGGFFDFLGNLVSRIKKLFVEEIDVSKNVNVIGNVSASYFIGDGRFISNLPAGNESDPIWASEKENYLNKTTILAFGYYNATDFVITDYFTKNEVIGLNYFNKTNFPYTHLSNFTNDLEIEKYNDSWINQTFYNKNEIIAFNYYNASDFNIGNYFTKLEILGFEYYNASDFAISDYYNKTEIENLINSIEKYNDGWINQTFFTKNEIISFGYYNITHFNISNYYSKSEIYNKLEVYNKSEIEEFGYINETIAGSNITISKVGNSRTIGINITSLKDYFDKIYQTIGEYPTINEIVRQIGNWSADKQNYYNKTEIDEIGFLKNESDPIFMNVNSSLWSSINLKLNENDQRYNETILVLSVNKTSNIMSLGFYNKTEVNNLILSSTNLSFNQSLTDMLYYPITNPREFVNRTEVSAYNDSSLILVVNSSLWGYIVLNENSWNSVFNVSYDSKAGTGNCPSGKFVVNVTKNGVECLPVSISESDPVFMNENASLWAEARNKFNVSYNNLLNQQCLGGKAVNGTLANGTLSCVEVINYESDPFWKANFSNMQNDCPIGNYAYGVFGNGSLKCRTDVSGNNETDPLWTANYSLMEMTFNVNRSNYWGNLNTINSTQMQNNNGILTIIEGWVISLFNNLFGTKTTDNLSEGITNKYDNRSWNESRANNLYAEKKWEYNQTEAANQYTNIRVAVDNLHKHNILNITGIDSNACSGTEKVRNVSLVNGDLQIECGVDETLNNAQTSVWEISQEFLTASASVFDPFLGTALSSGTIATQTSTSTRFGIARLFDSTTANGGYRIMTDTSSFLLAGNETAIFIWRHLAGRTTSSYRLGWQDSTTINTAPTDGCWFEINSTGADNNNTLTGRCRNNAGPTITATSFTLVPNEWYKGVITINSGATIVNFTLYNDTSQQIIWSGIVNANIPNTAGRETGFGIIAGETTTDAAAGILDIDYMRLIVNRTITR